MRIALLVPTTSNGMNWNDYKDSFLYKMTLKTFLLTCDKEHDYSIYIGVDRNDPIIDTINYKKGIERLVNIISKIKLIPKYVYMDEIKKGHLTKMWNKLFQIAYHDNNEYFFQCGDDISFNTKGWINDCIAKLQENDNVGVTGPINNNPRILTQTFVSRKHMEIFGFYFPEELINWFCDDWINMIYEKMNHIFLLKSHKCDNLGGKPRYCINNDTKFNDTEKRFYENAKKLNTLCCAMVEKYYDKYIQYLSLMSKNSI